MIALAASVVLALYIIIPGLLARFVYGLFIPLRVIASSKAVEATRSVVTALVPFLLALLVVWHIPFLNRFPVEAAYPELKAQDYQLVASCIYSENIFVQKTQAFWQALDRTLPRQALFLFWYYLLTALMASALGYLTASYRKLGSNRSYRWFANKFLFPYISEWHPLLTSFVFSDPHTVVRADILTTNDTLYRGRVSEHFVDSDGRLTGLILTEAKRYDRRTYLRDWEQDNEIDTELYWRDIPGAKLYIFADKIVNLNLDYESPDPPEEAVLKFLRDRLNRAVSIQFRTGSGSEVN